MTYHELMDLLGKQPFFDLAMAAQLSRERRHTLRVQLHRWVRQGKLIALRRGMYAWPEKIRGVPLNPAALANALYHPSYLSGLWALGFYGLIPEKVVVYTSVTTRGPRRFENAAGVFEYRHIKQETFFGYTASDVAGSRVLVARPEKALLDYWYLSRGAWTAERMAEMRFQNCDLVRNGLLERFARRFQSPRLLEIVRLWRQVVEEESVGMVTL